MAEDIALAATAQQLEDTRAALAQQQAYNRELQTELNQVKNMKQEVKVEKEVLVAPVQSSSPLTGQILRLKIKLT